MPRTVLPTDLVPCRCETKHTHTHTPTRLFDAPLLALFTRSPGMCAYVMRWCQAAAGVTLENYYVQPVCSPTRLVLSQQSDPLLRCPTKHMPSKFIIICACHSNRVVFLYLRQCPSNLFLICGVVWYDVWLLNLFPVCSPLNLTYSTLLNESHYNLWSPVYQVDADDGALHQPPRHTGQSSTP